MKPIGFALVWSAILGLLAPSTGLASNDVVTMDTMGQPTAGDEATVHEGAQVTIAFTITVPDINESIPNNVSQYSPGEQELIPGLEQALMGMKPGERKHVELGPEQAFGPYEEDKIVKVERDQLPPLARSGMVYETEQGQPFTIVAVADDTAVIDFNHPLAGQRLVFDVEVLKVEPGR